MYGAVGARRKGRDARAAGSLAPGRPALARGPPARGGGAGGGARRACRGRAAARAARRRPGHLRFAHRPDAPAPPPGDRMISTVEKVLFLKSIDLFRALPSEELAQIAEIAEEQPLALGDQVFGEGEPGDALYLIVEGKVKVHKGEKELVRLGIRDVFGEMAVLDSEPRSASVTAVEDSVCLKIGRDD
ncbi:MAG: cyclic nucleotide-binding domain-containing protein, partial [Deltaproteobacteria bacterium]